MPGRDVCNEVPLHQAKPFRFQMGGKSLQVINEYGNIEIIMVPVEITNTPGYTSPSCEIGLTGHPLKKRYQLLCIFELTNVNPIGKFSFTTGNYDRG